MTDIAIVQDQIAQGGRKMDMDKETVQVVAIVGGVTIAVAALVFDGELGYALGTGVLTLASSVVSYIFGQKSCLKKEDEENGN